MLSVVLHWPTRPKILSRELKKLIRCALLLLSTIGKSFIAHVITQNENIVYSWVPNRRVYSFIRHQRNMKKETDTKTDKSI